MLLRAAIEQFLDHRRRKNLRRNTIRQYRNQLLLWCKWRDKQHYDSALHTVQIHELHAFLNHIAAQRSAYTVESYRRCIRSLWRYLTSERLLNPDQLEFFADGRTPRPQLADSEPRPYCDDEQLATMLAACGEHTELAERNKAILLLLFESGMRIAELCGLTDEQIDLQANRANISGKGRKRGWVFWGPRAAAQLRRYLMVRSGKQGGPLFRSCGPGAGGPILPGGVRLMVKRLGVELPKGAPLHWLRHGFAHRAIDAGLELSQVQQLMRHSSPETTMRYLRERPEKLQNLHEQVFRREKRNKRNENRA